MSDFIFDYQPDAFCSRTAREWPSGCPTRRDCSAQPYPVKKSSLVSSTVARFPGMGENVTLYCQEALGEGNNRKKKKEEKRLISTALNS